MKKKKVVYIIRRTVGGMQKHLFDLINNIGDRYKMYVIFPPDESIARSLDEKQIRYCQIEIPDKISPIGDFKSTIKITKCLKKIKPDIVHIHGNKSAFVGRVACKLAGTKKVVVTVHNFLIWQRAGRIKRFLGGLTERFLSRWTSKIITVSHALKDNLIGIEKLKQEKIKVIHNGYSPREYKGAFGLREVVGAKDNEIILLSIGRFVKDKGHEYLIKAFAKLDGNFKLAIAGKGILEDELRKLVKDLNVEDRVFFLGFVDKPDSLMREADIFIFPSISEPMGLVSLEAMDARTPLIASGVEGILEVVEDDKSGLLVQPADPNNLAKAIERLANDVKLRDKLVQGGLERLKVFSVEKMIDEVVAIYEAN